MKWGAHKALRPSSRRSCYKKKKTHKLAKIQGVLAAWLDLYPGSSPTSHGERGANHSRAGPGAWPVLRVAVHRDHSRGHVNRGVLSNTVLRN